LIVADANLLSETSKVQPDPVVTVWIQANYEKLYLSTPVLSELRYGCARLPPSARRRELERWLSDLTVQFADRILPFDRRAAEAHGTMRAHLMSIGKTCSPSDSYIAAIALSLACPVVTRNINDFQWTGVVLIDPWSK
jgi:predicted nucleic acid-binding protein